MGTIGERMRKLRRELNLTQTEFASRIGSVQNSITRYENNQRNPPQPLLSLICHEFNVSEQWLRTGEGEMFNPAPESEIDELADRYGLSETARVMVEKFVKLKPDAQKAICDYVEEVAAAITDADDGEMSIDEKVELYRRELLREKEERERSEA